MSKLITALQLIRSNPNGIILALAANNLFNILPDSLHLRIVFKAELGYSLNLKNPVTFSEKLQWLKLHDRRPIYVNMVDKCAVRNYIKANIGEDFLIPLIGVYDSVKDIPWDSLPKQFVIKCTHGSGCNIICDYKSKIDIYDACMKLNAWMKRNWYWAGREWPYKNVKPRIIIENYLSNNGIIDYSDKVSQSTSLSDYKFYCFNGMPTFCQVISNRRNENGNTNYDIDIFDMEWNRMLFTGLNSPGKPYPKSKSSIAKPRCFDQMLEISKQLALETKFVRIDLYEVNGHVYFGEFTLYPLSGFGVFEPEEWNIKLGNLIDLF